MNPWMISYFNHPYSQDLRAFFSSLLKFDYDTQDTPICTPWKDETFHCEIAQRLLLEELCGEARYSDDSFSELRYPQGFTYLRLILE